MTNSNSRDIDDADDDSTSRSSSPDFISYRTKPEWADVEPISLRSQSSIMDIKYTARYEETFSYFRAMLVRDELSERSLALTADCIELQRSNFTVWYFRRRILRRLSHHLQNELAFVEQVIEDEPKNYQVWHHRKTIVDWLRDGSHDKQLITSVLSVDNKNYHAWQHRQWVIKEFHLWDGELEFTDAQISMDVQNNSAWNHRCFVVTETKRFEDPKWLDDEIRYVHRRIEESPNNESSWSYLRGILNLAFNSIGSHTETQEFCERRQTDENCRCPHMLAFVLDTIREQLSKSGHVQNRDSLKSKAFKLCDTLSSTDRVRSRYWTYIKLRIEEL